MDLTKFTERARGFIQSAQTIALRENHQRLEPIHILKSLLDDPEGFASNLIQKSGADAASVRQNLDIAFQKLSVIKGDAGQVILDQKK